MDCLTYKQFWFFVCFPKILKDLMNSFEQWTRHLNRYLEKWSKPSKHLIIAPHLRYITLAYSLKNLKYHFVLSLESWFLFHPFKTYSAFSEDYNSVKFQLVSLLSIQQKIWASKKYIGLQTCIWNDYRHYKVSLRAKPLKSQAVDDLNSRSLGVICTTLMQSLLFLMIIKHTSYFSKVPHGLNHAYRILCKN